MKHYTNISDLPSLEEAIHRAIAFKKNPIQHQIGKGKTIVLLFFNSSLRTRLSTEKASRN